MFLHRGRLTMSPIRRVLNFYFESTTHIFLSYSKQFEREIFSVSGFITKSNDEPSGPTHCAQPVATRTRRFNP